MKYSELEKLKPYRITKKSSDGTFLMDDVIWISEGGEVNSVHGGGFIYPDEGDSATWDFEAEYAENWEVITINGNEICRKVEKSKMRKCKGRYYKKRQYHDFETGYFHQWGCNYDEFETGAGNYSTAIVELPNGEVVMPVADDIQFLDTVEEE